MSFGTQREDASGVQRLFGRHLVGLYAALDHADLQRQHILRSGFIVEIQTSWFWVTAGHVLGDIKEFLDHMGNVHEVFLLSACENSTPIPFDFAVAIKWYLDVDRQVDVGFIRLDSEVQIKLISQGVLPISLDTLTSPDLEHTRYVLMGLPDEFTKFAKDPRGDVIAMYTPTPLYLDRLSDEATSSGHLRLRFDYSGNDIVSGLNPWTSVIGMSGGPIFALKTVDGGVRYWGIAIQSSVDARTMTAFASPLNRLFAYILSETNGQSEQQAT